MTLRHELGRSQQADCQSFSSVKPRKARRSNRPTCVVTGFCPMKRDKGTANLFRFASLSLGACRTGHYLLETHLRPPQSYRDGKGNAIPACLSLSSERSCQASTGSGSSLSYGEAGVLLNRALCRVAVRFLRGCEETAKRALLPPGLGKRVRASVAQRTDRLAHRVNPRFPREGSFWLLPKGWRAGRKRKSRKRECRHLPQSFPVPPESCQAKALGFASFEEGVGAFW